MFDTEKLIDAMEAAGYWYDDLESYETWIIFRGDYCTSMYFNSWEEVNDWLRGVVFDDPAVSDAVEKILN